MSIDKPRMNRGRTDYVTAAPPEVMGVDLAKGKDTHAIMYYDPLNQKWLPLKVLILGYGGHGKDEFAERLARSIRGFRFESSSLHALDRIVYPWFQSHLPGYYENEQQCFEDRGNWRPLWHWLIKDYNSDDLTRMTTEIMAYNDCYVGMRNDEELQACLKDDLFTHVFWVCAGDRVGPEDESSCSVAYNPDTMFLVDNSRDLDYLQEEVGMIIDMFAGA